MSETALTSPASVTGAESSLNSEDVKQRAVTGFKHLGTRTALGLVLRVVSSLVLTRLLVPEDYALFTIVAGVAGLGMYLGDFGAGMVMVRQKETPSSEELSTVFWFQQAVVTAVVTGILLLRPLVIVAYKLLPGQFWLVVLMASGLYLSSLRTVAVINLERVLRFDSIARAEMAESVCSTIVTIACALKGLGVWSFVLGSLTSRAVGLILLWLASPWRPLFIVRLNILRRVLMQGTGFQLIVLAPVLLASGVPIIITQVLGKHILGLVTWSATFAGVVNTLNGVLCRVALPAFGRLQGQVAEMTLAGRVAVVRITLALHLLIVPAILLVPLALPIFYDHRWIEAIPILRWALMDAVVMCGVNVYAQLMNVGRLIKECAITSVVGGVMRLVIIGGFAMFLPYQYLMVASYFVAFAELVIEASFVQHRLAGGRGAVAQTVVPSLVFGAFVAGALLLELVVVKVSGSLLLATVINLAAFVAFCFAYDKLAKGKPIKTELMKVWGMALSRRA